MIFIWGFRLFGRVDEVPGIFHVASKFFHVWYIPLIPVGSHMVFRKTADGFTGVPVPLRFKSVLLAWMRAACIVAALFFGSQAVLALTELHEPIAPHAAQGPANPGNPAGVPAGAPASSAAPQPAVSDFAIHVIVAVVLLVLCALFIGAAVLLWKLRWFSRASYARAMKLCEHAKMSDEGRIMIERYFGRISEADAQAAIAAAAADRAELEKLAEEGTPA